MFVSKSNTATTFVHSSWSLSLSSSYCLLFYCSCKPLHTKLMSCDHVICDYTSNIDSRKLMTLYYNHAMDAHFFFHISFLDSSFVLFNNDSSMTWPQCMDIHFLLFYLFCLSLYFSYCDQSEILSPEGSVVTHVWLPLCVHIYYRLCVFYYKHHSVTVVIP